MVVDDGASERFGAPTVEPVRPKRSMPVGHRADAAGALARNRAIGRTRGAFLDGLDADDPLRPGLVARSEKPAVASCDRRRA